MLRDASVTCVYVRAVLLPLERVCCRVGGNLSHLKREEFLLLTSYGFPFMKNTNDLRS